MAETQRSVFVASETTSETILHLWICAARLRCEVEMPPFETHAAPVGPSGSLRWSGSELVSAANVFVTETLSWKPVQFGERNRSLLYVRDQVEEGHRRCLRDWVRRKADEEIRHHICSSLSPRR
ncbi:uncharacterized protein V6R79_012237 [Siganus canaliculatus]